jgi:hypothetical protein
MKTTPARITFTENGVEQQVRFHSVILESHKAVSQSTSFPVATGFEVSRHTIKKNRQITIKALISNVLLEGGNNVDVKTTNTCKTLHEVCASLVDNGTVCNVVSNLGVYDPVIFHSYDTKTEEGYVDAILITLQGEQKEVKGSLNKTGPKALQFRILDETEKSVRLAELEPLGYFPDPVNSQISEATVDLGTDFSIETVDEVGEPITTTYVSKGQDPTTGGYAYEVHKHTPGLYQTDAELAETLSLDESTDTVLGTLNRSTYGAHYENVTTLGDGSLSSLGDVTDTTGSGKDFLVAGVQDLDSTSTTGVEIVEDPSSTSLPTADDMVVGAARLGNADTVNENVQELKPLTILKIEDVSETIEQGNVI